MKKTTHAKGGARRSGHDTKELTHSDPANERLEEIILQDVVLDIAPSAIVVYLHGSDANRL